MSASRILPVATVLLIIAVTAAMVMNGQAAPDAYGTQQALKEAVEEQAELTAPFDTLISRQMFGADPGVDPASFMAEAQAQAAAMAATPGSYFSETEWQTDGPFDIGGRVLDVAPDPNTPGRIFIAAASGGVWVSDDYDQPLGDMNPRIDEEEQVFREAWPRALTQAIGALVAADDDGTTVLWAGTGESGPGGGSLSYGGNGVYKSVDGGETWQLMGLEATQRIGRIVVDPTDADRVFVAASGPLYNADEVNRGLYLTEDGGLTWNKVLNGDNATTGIVDVQIDPDDPSIVFAAAWDHIREPDIRRYNGIGSGLYRSTDGGQTFDRIAIGVLGPHPAMGRIGIAAAADSDVLYVTASGESGAYAGAYVSEDNGTTFTPIAHPLVAQNNMVYGWWFGRIYVDPHDADRVWHLGLNLYLSEDGGINWAAAGAGTAVTGGDVHADQHAMAFDPHVPGRVYLGNDGGVYVNDQNGRGNTNAWNFAEVQPFSQLYAFDVSQQFPDRHVAGLQDNGVNRNYSPDPDGPGGFSVGEDGNGDPATGWNSINGGDGERSTISPKNPLIVYMCSQYGACSVSTNGGNSRSSFENEVPSTRKNWLTPIELDPFNPEVAYTGGEFMSRSTDNGQNWSLVSTNDFSNGPGRETNPLFRNFGTLTSIAPAGDTIYAGTDDANLWYSHDAGATWTQATDPDLPKSWVTRVEVNPLDPQEAYVTYSGFRQGREAPYVLRTTDGGVNWQNISTNLPQAALNDVNVVGEHLVVASDIGVFISERGTASPVWQIVGTALPNVPAHELRWHEDTQTLYVATFGRGIWKVSLADEGVSNASTHAGTWYGPAALAGASAAPAPLLDLGQ